MASETQASSSTSSSANFDFRAVERRTREFWDQNNIYQRAKKLADPTKKFFFVDGPPYTSGKVHLGTAWNKTLKDVISRVKRMQGFDVWDRPGYDMHGLPTEKATEKELGITTREQILALGTEKFIEHCRALCIRNMNDMTEVFKSMGVWMQWDDPYISIDRDYMEGEWWLIKRVHDLGRLYEGEKTMTWDSINGTALAKHELYYSTVVDKAIYVRFKLLSKDAMWENTSVVVWTTTPWTIPFNLAVMVNPTFNYCQVEMNGATGKERVLVAEALLTDFLETKLGLDREAYTVLQTLPGSSLKGLAYQHPFDQLTNKYHSMRESMPAIHTILTNSDFVTTDVGTGIVHVAPGCGPEDYVVGQQNGIKPFNAVNVSGVYEGFHPFDGLLARKDDAKFIELLKSHGALVHQHDYEHEYPFGERSKEPVIYRTTKQWFFRVEDLKPKLLEEHEKIRWVPDAAGNSFRSWLENLRDNSISKQRFWGTPVPIWRNIDDPSDYIVVGSVKELVELAGLEAPPADIHIPTVDTITFTRVSPKDNKPHVYRRVPDVLDVWVDAGTASFNTLRFPARVGEDTLKQWFPMTFILEGKDQIRGWFNLLHVLSVMVFGQRSFNACYMHGFINDSLGRKMSKSVGNYILPAEVTEKYGADVMRLYMTSGAAPALDLNYNFKDLDNKMKSAKVFWNLHKWVFDTAEAAEVEPLSLSELLSSPLFGLEEKYVFSKLNSTIAQMTQYVADGDYRLNEFPVPVEQFLLEVLSHTYLQLTWEKASSGTDEEKSVTISVLYHSLATAMTLLAPVMPFFSEEVYRNLRAGFDTLGSSLYPEESVHLRPWPSVDRTMIDSQLEKDMDIAKDAITAILAGRDKISVGVKWPLQEVRANVTLPGYLPSLQRCEQLILQRTGVKHLNFEPLKVDVEIRPNSKNIGKQFGPKTQAVLAYIQQNAAALAALIEPNGPREVTFIPDMSKPNEKIALTSEHIIAKRAPPENYIESSGQFLQVFLNTVRTPALDQEGYLREVTRRVQMLRKKLSLKRKDKVNLTIAVDPVSSKIVFDSIVEGKSFLVDRAGVANLQLVKSKDEFVGFPAENISAEKVKQYSFDIAVLSTPK